HHRKRWNLPLSPIRNIGAFFTLRSKAEWKHSNEGGTAEAKLFRPIQGTSGLFLFIIEVGEWEMKKLTIVVKIGSSSLTNDQGEIDKIKLSGYVDAIAALKKAKHTVILVSSGAVAAGF